MVSLHSSSFIHRMCAVCVASKLAHQPADPYRLTIECDLMLDEEKVAVQISHISHISQSVSNLRGIAFLTYQPADRTD